ncbi:MAG TPA: TlpA disulfide reductase family protein [Steroidobacteraceae bacterium]|nr:TlpA disulfide reductase family protein [Steroidobacteraceae bacterium]
MKSPAAPLLLAVALIGAAAGFLAYRLYPRPAPSVASLPAPAAPVAVPAPPANAELPGNIPPDVPDLRLADLAGKLHPLRDGSARPHLYNFWATWCEPCRREIPLLNALQRRYRGDQLEVVGIAIDFRDAVKQFLRVTPMDYTLRVGEEDGYEAAQKFGMGMALPFSVFSDSQDRIIAVKVGELHREEAESILAQIRQLRAGKITLQQAHTAIDEALRQYSVARAKQTQKS